MASENDTTGLAPQGPRDDAGHRLLALGSAASGALVRHGRKRKLARGETVLAEGEEPAVIGFVDSGILRMQKTLPDGRVQIVGLLVPGDTFGRVFDGKSAVAIEAATDAVLTTYERRTFESLLMRHPDLEHLLLLHVLDELDAAREWLTLLAAPRVIERVAGFLLILCRRWPQRALRRHGGRPVIEIHVPISRTDVAHYLGTRPETLSRVLGQLVRENVLEMVDPYTFRVRDLDALVDIAGNEDYANCRFLADLRAGTAEA